jgi:glycosyltransferase involved in cell wall biosynthesis
VNILLVNWQDPDHPQAGGAEIHLFEIFGRLAQRDHRVRLVCCGWRGADPRAQLGGIEIERSGTRGTFALVGRRAVRRAIKRERPDIVVEDINKLPLFLATLTGLPLCVIVPHLFGTTAFREVSWPAAALVWLSERPIPRVYRRAGFHAISESTRDDLVHRGIPRQRIQVIHPGVDTTRYTPDPSVHRASPPAFLYVGRLKRYKGVELAIRALALARQERPDLALEIAGDGDDRPRLEKLTASLGVSEGVKFHGRVSEAEKIRLFRSSWANLFPSPKEGWGITVMEAAACGTPSLASDSPGLRDSVRDGTTGFLVSHGDVTALARRMLEFAADRSLVERLGAAARQQAVRMTWEGAADQTEAHLESLIRAAPNSQSS